MPRDKTPAEFYGSGKKYKVLWLLHGTFGDHTDWIRKSNIELYACEKDLIVVMPSALNSNYAEWAKFSIGFDMYHYLTEELMPLVYNWFPASDKREDNFIAGLSMGGRGTLVYALNHPEKFAAAGWRSILLRMKTPGALRTSARATPRCPDSISPWAKTTSSMSISSTSKSTRRRSVLTRRSKNSTVTSTNGVSGIWPFSVR